MICIFGCPQESLVCYNIPIQTSVPAAYIDRKSIMAGALPLLFPTSSMSESRRFVRVEQPFRAQGKGQVCFCTLKVTSVQNISVLHKSNLNMLYLDMCLSSDLLHNDFPAYEQEFTGLGVFIYQQ